ncbi:MAG: CAP domain-containing protein [Alphaproteobacteria bacterium]|nr:CAP domain-containing protein [Alphaproteobacteria bacterium]
MSVTFEPYFAPSSVLVRLPDGDGAGVLVQSENETGAPPHEDPTAPDLGADNGTAVPPLLSLYTVRIGDGVDPIEADFAALLNAYRAENGLAPVALSQDLSLSANRKALDIVENDAFSHIWSGGESLSDGFRTLYPDGSFSLLAENLAVGALSAEAVMQAWTASPSHRDTLLNPSLDTVGVGFVDGRDQGYGFGTAWVLHLGDDVVGRPDSVQAPILNGGDFSVAFDPAGYLTANPDLIAAGLDQGDALDHYLASGFAEERELAFDASGYLALNPDLTAAGFTAEEAEAHYLNFGWLEGRPTDFDPDAYLAANPDLVAAGIVDPAAATAHYLASGRFEDRWLGFDAAAYLVANPELLAAGLTTYDQAIEHYRAFGAIEGRAFFDRDAYLVDNPDVAASGLEALDHYQQAGAADGRAMPLRGSDRADLFLGGNGDERYRGLDGDDILFGRAGDDRIDGGAGNDVVSGGSGTNVLTGGAGADRFRVGEGVDTVVDFNAADGDVLVGPDGALVPVDGSVGDRTSAGLDITFDNGATVTLLGVLPASADEALAVAGA